MKCEAQYQFGSILLFYFLHRFITSYLLDPNILPNTLFSFQNLRGQTARPHKTNSICCSYEEGRCNGKSTLVFGKQLV
jgi:hypothetical protein